MKKLSFLITAVCCIALIFASCDKPGLEKDGVETIKTQSIVLAPSNDKVDSVYAMMGTVENGLFPVAKTTYKDGNFTIKLPKELPDGYLMSLENMPGELSDTLDISDPSAKLNMVLYFSSIKDNEEVGTFIYGKLSDTMNGMSMALYMYSDKPARLSGSVPELGGLIGSMLDPDREVEATVNISLKKGWNIIAATVKNISGDVVEAEVTAVNDTKGYTWYYFGGDEVPF